MDNNLSKMSLTTFFCEYNILPEHATRDTCMTVFGGMTEEDDLRELGEVKLLGRWACVGEARGFCIAQAKNAVDMQRWLNAWVTMADIKVVPCLDDNEHRELLLGSKSEYIVSYDKVDSNAKDGESLYFIKYQFKDGKKDEGFAAFASLTKEADDNDSGNCTSLGRWHVPSKGCGYAIASCPSALDIYKWAYNWNSVCDCEVVPVTKDSETRDIIKNGLGYEVKHKMVMQQLAKLTGNSDNTFFCM